MNLNYFSDRYLLSIFALLMTIAGGYLIMQAWKNRNETPKTAIVLVNLLSIAMVIGGVCSLLFLLFFGLNT